MCEGDVTDNLRINAMCNHLKISVAEHTPRTVMKTEEGLLTKTEMSGVNHSKFLNFYWYFFM